MSEPISENQLTDEELLRIHLDGYAISDENGIRPVEKKTERRSAVIDWTEQHIGEDFKLFEWQRQYARDMLTKLYREEARLLEQDGMVKVKLQTHMPASRTGMSPSLTWVDEPFSSYVLVRPGQPVKEPVDYYKSATWVANTETLLRYLKTWRMD